MQKAHFFCIFLHFRGLHQPAGCLYYICTEKQRITRASQRSFQMSTRSAELVKVDGKFAIRCNGVKLVSSKDRKSCVDRLPLSKKAQKLGITSMANVVDKTDDPNPLGSGLARDSQFDINTRFKFMRQLTDMVVTGATPSLIITGEPGWSKSFTVQEALKAAGLREHRDFEIIKGFSTPKAMYRALYENQDGLVIFDDCDSVLKDDTSINILKGALDSYERRVIHWRSERGDDDLPNHFEFKGQVIFISNRAKDRMNPALISRSFLIDVSMTMEEKFERLEGLLPDLGPTDTEMSVKRQVLDIMVKHKDIAPDISIRTFLRGLKIRLAAAKTGDDDWNDLVTYMITM